MSRTAEVIDLWEKNMILSAPGRIRTQKKLKKQITINIDAETIDYFKSMSSVTGIPYQTLINLYLADCAAQKRQLSLSWGA